MTPRLSVLMPVRDAERYVQESVESILAQSFRDFEFLIFDDGSRDETAKRVGELAQRDSRIVLYRGGADGLAVWLREGVRRARGELVARMDADDVARPERFARQFAYLDAHPEVIALGSDALIVDPERRPVRRVGVLQDHEAIDAELLRGNGVALVHPTLMARREALLAAGNYRTEYPWAEDLELFLRLAEHGRFANLDEVLLEYRRHPDQVNMTRAAEQRRSVLRILREARVRRGLPPGFELPQLRAPETPSDAWHALGRGALGGGHRDTARHYAGLLLQDEPFSPRSWRLWLRAALGFSLAHWRARRAQG